MAIGEGDIRAIKLAQLAAETEEREFAQCTFRPELASHSERLMRQRTAVMRSAGVSAHATLYADATRRQRRQQLYAEWLPDDVTFQPSINVWYGGPSWWTGSDGGSESGGGGGGVGPPVEDRLLAAKARAEKHLKEMDQAYNANVDPETRQPYFRPTTGRPPAASSRPRPEGLPAHEYLYALRGEFEDKRAFLVAKERQAEVEARHQLASERSAAIVEKVKRRRFAQIFRWLDSRQEGAVFLRSALTKELDEEVARDVLEAAKLVEGAEGRGRNAARVCALLYYACHAPCSAVVKDLAQSVGEGSADGAWRRVSVRATSPSAEPVNIQQFHQLMDHVVTTVRFGPRNYLAPHVRPPPPAPAVPDPSPSAPLPTMQTDISF